MNASLGSLSDWDFVESWGAMSQSDRDELDGDERAQAYERYRKLDAFGAGASAERLSRIEARVDAVVAARHELTPAARESNLIDWATLTGEPPPFPWIMEHWLSWHPTLLAGRGGIGKSLLIQQLATALACGLPTWCAAGPPLKVLYWACEDDRDQLHRRQHTICMHHQLGFSALGNLFVDARQGLENTLMTTEYGRPMWTPRIELLRQQINDRQIDVLMLDNIAHVFGANENIRHDVTIFVNGICGLVEGRPFCPILLGHPSKSPNSEYSGSTAWENAVRMRWYLNDRMPDQKSADEEKPDPDYRVLAKRKVNYTRLDYVQFKFESGYLQPEAQDTNDPDIVVFLRGKRARSIIRSAVDTLGKVGVFGSEKSGRNYLPHLIMQNKLGEDATKTELSTAVRAMILDGDLVIAEVGTNAARRPIIGLRAK